MLGIIHSDRMTQDTSRRPCPDPLSFCIYTPYILGLPRFPDKSKKPCPVPLSFCIYTLYVLSLPPFHYHFVYTRHTYSAYPASSTKLKAKRLYQTPLSFYTRHTYLASLYRVGHIRHQAQSPAPSRAYCLLYHLSRQQKFVANLLCFIVIGK